MPKLRTTRRSTAATRKADDELILLLDGPARLAVSESDEQTRNLVAPLGAALLVYMTGVTLIVTLLPFQFSRPRQWHVMVSGSLVDTVANVLLFLPLGFLYRLARARSQRQTVLPTLVGGLLLSMSIEGLQQFEPDRYTSLLDVVSNGAGAVLGSLLYDVAARAGATDGRWIGRTFLELPLMGLLYLTIPLLWLTALAAVDAPQWAWVSVPLAVFGGLLLGGVMRHVRPTGDRAAAPWRYPLTAAAGLGLGMFPALGSNPLALTTGAAAAALSTRIAFTRQPQRPTRNRRFEIPVLRSAAPFYAAFVVAAVAFPLIAGASEFSLGAGFTGTAVSWTRPEILRFLVYLAAFTLLGYMIAEYRGREEGRLADAFPRMLYWTLAATTAAEVILGFRTGHGASIARWVVLSCASLYGGWLYRLQLNYVVALLNERTGDPAPTDL